MKIGLFDFQLDKSKIALAPANPRDHSKLMILDSSRKITHKHFYDLPDLLSPKDVIVINDTKVTPTYFEIKRWRKGNTSNIRLNIIRQLDDGDWVILAKPKKRLKITDKLIFSDKDHVSADVVGFEDEHVKIRFNQNMDMMTWIESNGKLPLPPYITAQRELRDEDKESYQTVYAEHAGSAAAPTAGLHFTKKLLDSIQAKGIRICNVILHVGSGTFSPIKTDNILDIELERAIELIAKPTQRGNATLKTFGEHPSEKKNITAHDGKFGPYVKCGKINASLLGDQTIDSLTLEDAIKLIDDRKQKIGLKKKKK